MTPESWAVVKRLFERSLELSPAERMGFVRANAGGDEEIAREVLSLLDAHGEAGPFLESPTSPMPPGSTAAGAVPPARVGPYEVIRELGSGGMGTVYLAEQIGPDFRRPVAVKVIRSGFSSSLFVRRFQNERRILAGLSHPNIAALLDGGTTAEGVPYFALEYVAGTPLNEYVDTRRLSVPGRLALMRTICSAVQYAHQNLVVHRDLKPGNILVTAEGVPKLLDFGLAKVLEPGPDAAPEATVTELRIFTPAYASPEQVKGGSITTASDVYSLGVVLYVLLTGKKPYRVTTGSPDELARAVVEQEPTRPSLAVQPDGKLARLLEGDLDTIVLKAMHKDPPRRYASADQLSEDIRRHLEGRPVKARPDSPGYRFRMFVARHRAGVATAALVVAVVAGAFVETVRERARAERRFNDVRKLASSYLFEFHDAIENLAGSTPARQLVVKRGLEYLDSLAMEAKGDRSLQRELAAAYVRVGDVQGGGHFGNLGDTEGAKSSYGKALALREGIARSRNADPRDRIDLVDSRLRMSLLQTRLGDHKAAEATARLAVAEAERLDDSEPLARASHRLGQTLVDAEEFGEARHLYEREVAIYEKLSASEPGNARVRRGLAIGYKYVGGILAREGNYKESVASYRKALAIEESFVAADPANAGHRRDLSFTLSDLGYNLLYLGERKAALDAYRRAVGLREALAGADPTDVTIRRALASIYLRLGLAEVETGETGGLEHGKEALAILDELVARNPRSVEDKARRAEMLADIGDLVGLGHESRWRGTLDPPPPPAVCPWHRRSLEAWRELQKEGLLSKSQQRRNEYVAGTVAICDRQAATPRRR